MSSKKEGIEERIQREKREKWEASDEYRQQQADKAQDKANIALAAGTQVSDSDVAAEAAKSQGGAEAEVRAWVSEVRGESLAEGEPLGDQLKSGVILCGLVNKIKPGTIGKFSKSKMPFPQRENIKSFIDAARTLGVHDADNFETGDLFEKSNMKQVIICIQALGRAAGKVPGYTGPSLSNKGSAKKRRNVKRSDSKVMQLGSSLKLDLGRGKPVEPGSMEWIRQQAEAKAAEEAKAASPATGGIGGRTPPGLAGMFGGSGGGQKSPGKLLQTPKGLGAMIGGGGPARTPVRSGHSPIDIHLCRALGPQAPDWSPAS
jgi:hypothetical protein